MVLIDYPVHIVMYSDDRNNCIIYLAMFDYMWGLQLTNIATPVQQISGVITEKLCVNARGQRFLFLQDVIFFYCCVRVNVKEGCSGN